MSAPLGEVSVLVRPDLSGFRAELEAQLVAATKGVAIPVAIAPVASGASATATAATATHTAAVEGQVAALQAKGAVLLEVASAEKVATAATLTASQAQVEEAAATLTAARAKEKDAAATTADARAHENLARGAGATTLSLLGIRGATLAASGAFLIGAAAVTVTAKSIREASRDAEAAARVSRILGDELGKGSEVWAHTLAESFGLSATAALKFQGAIAETLHNVEFAPSQIAPLSQRLVQLAADMAAFNNVDVGLVLRSMQLGITGNLRGLRTYGVLISNANVQQEAFRETGKTVATELTRQELVTARINLILNDTRNQVGAAANRQKDLAQQTRILESELANLAVGIGGLVIPALTKIVSTTSKVVIQLGRVASIIGKLPEPFRRSATAQDKAARSSDGFWHSLTRLDNLVGGSLKSQITTFDNQLRVVGDYFGLVTQKSADTNSALAITAQDFAAMLGPINFFTQALGGAINQFDVAAAKFRQGLHLQVTITTNIADTASRNLLKLQAEGAPLSVQLAAAQKELEARTKATAAAQALGAQGSSQTQAVVEKRLQDQLAARNNVEGIQSQIDAAAKRGAAAGAKAAKTAQQIADEQDQQLLTEQQIAQGWLDIAHTRAEGTKSLEDDLAVARRQVKLLDKQIIEAQAINDRSTRIETIQQLTIQKIQEKTTIKQIKQDQVQRKIDAANTARDREAQRLELNIEIANTNKNVRAEIAARQARIRFDEEQIKSVHGDIVRRKQLQLEIAQDRQAIKDLKKQNDAKKDELKALEFSFLQTQSGFVANLLGNLLPFSSVAGTVGGGAVGTSTAGDFSPSAHHVAPQRSGSVALDVSKATRGGAGPQAASSGQMSALIAIARAQLFVLQALAGKASHPEATSARSWQSASMQVDNWWAT